MEMGSTSGEITSALAVGTVKTAASRLHEAADRRSAFMAGLTGAPVDRQTLHEIADLAPWLNMVTKACSAVLDGPRQHRSYRVRKPFRTLATDGVGTPPRRQPGPVQRLARIYVADPRHQPLVEQGVLTGPRRAARPAESVSAENMLPEVPAPYRQSSGASGRRTDRSSRIGAGR